MYTDVNIKSPETMRRKTPIAMVTPVGIAEGVEVDNVSVGLMVCSFTVTVDVSMFVLGTLILDVVVILGSVTKEPKFQQRYDITDLTTILLCIQWEAQWAGRQYEGLVTAFALHYSWVYRRKGSVHRIDVGVAGGRSELFCIQCVVSLGPAGRRNVRCCVLSDYACLLAQSLLRTSVAGPGWVLPKHRLIS